jgi:hypothetical protein
MPTIEAASEPAIISSTLQVKKNPNRTRGAATILIQFQKLPASLFPSMDVPIY